jgi:DNA polymerase III epsilon subunit-like protein
MASAQGEWHQAAGMNVRGFSAYRDHSFTGFTRAVVVDVETTGIDTKSDRIVAIRCLRGNIEELATRGFTDLDVFKARFNPGLPILPVATHGHGIKDLDVAEKGTFAAIAAELREFIGPLPLIGHHVSYHKAFLTEEFSRAEQQPLDQNNSYCLMKRLRDHFGYSAGYLSLAEACERFGLEGRAELHRHAAEDAERALQLAGCLYQLDNNLLPTTIRAPGRVAGARASIAALGGTTLVLALVLSILGAASTLLFL